MCIKSLDFQFVLVLGIRFNVWPAIEAFKYTLTYGMWYFRGGMWSIQTKSCNWAAMTGPSRGVVSLSSDSCITFDWGQPN